MKKLKNDELGFGVIEVILLLVIVVAIVCIGWYVWKAKQNTDSIYNSAASTSIATKPVVKTKSTTTTTDPYAGWKTYTLSQEKLTFKYPSQWSVSNTTPPTATQDHVTLTASDGFTFNVIDGVSNGGDPIIMASSAPVAVTYVGQSDSLVFTYGTGSVGRGSSDGLIAGAVLLANPNDQSTLPLDKIAVGPNDTTGAMDAKYIYISATTKTQLTLAQAPSNPDFKNTVLIIASMHY